MYSVKVEKDSITQGGHRLVSMVITLPRVVLAEIVTHRLSSETWNDGSVCERTATPDISKNSASSRAIPFERMVGKVKEDPYMPMWSLQQKGMQGIGMTDEQIIQSANYEWLACRDDNIASARKLHDLGIHKQDCNRLLEPWQWVTQIVTSSNWDNFFALRCHEKAFPPFRKLARMMYLAMLKSTPKPLEFGEWHLPFVEYPFSWMSWTWPMMANELPDYIKYSAARCAWISYENHEKQGTPEAMLRTFDSLFKEAPIHGSPLEHQATPVDLLHGICYMNQNNWRSNLSGWVQARKLIAGEKTVKYQPSEAEIASWGDLS